MTKNIADREPDPEIVYADIFHLPHHVSDRHPRMSLHDRAAQFAPFAALTGYDEMVDEEARLTDREIEVMALIVQGYINKEIADRLNIGLTTVITHRKNIMEKLGMKSVSALTIYAVMHGYVDINKI